jgi:hypothetical protein
LVHREIAAGATKDFVFGVKVNELETIAESVSLANHCANHDGVVWKHEAQLYDLAQQSLDCQHRSHPGFANVHTTAHQHAARPGVDGDVNLKFEPGAPAGIRDCPMGPRRGRILIGHIPNFLGLTIQCDTEPKQIAFRLASLYSPFSCLIGVNLIQQR